MIRAMASILALSVLAVVCVAQPSASSGTGSPTQEESLRRFLLKHVSDRGFRDDEETRYARAFVDLNGDRDDEAIVFLVGGPWCGSGGCQTLVLRPEGDSWELVVKALRSDTPIRVSNKRSFGWRNITLIRKHSGGPRYTDELRFNGQTYRTIPQAERVRDSSSKTVIPSPERTTVLR